MNRIGYLNNLLEQKYETLYKTKIGAERDYLYLDIDRIEKLYTLQYFLSNRNNIKALFSSLYITEDSIEVIQKKCFDLFDFDEDIDFEGVSVYSGDIKKLVFDYVIRLYLEVDRYNLKLF